MTLSTEISCNSLSILITMVEYKETTITSISDHTYNIKHVTVINPFKESLFTVSSFVLFKINKNISSKEEITRPYTPTFISANRIEFMIKIYPNGEVTSFIDTLNVGNTLKISEPIHKLEYNSNKYNSIWMLAGGTGITPMLQILKCDSQTVDSQVRFVLLFCNKSVRDIFLIEELNKLEKEMGERLKVVHVISDLDISIKDLEKEFKHIEGGRINREVLVKHGIEDLKNKRKLIYVCGPPGFMECVSGDKTPKKEQGALSGLLKDLEFTEEDVYKF